MTKSTTLVVFLLISSKLFSQVGINTENPLGIFHIDGHQDNALVNQLTNKQQDNDFVVTNDGYVGIGTVQPKAKLQINSGGTTENPIEGIIIIDGNEGTGKVLMSDENGLGTWKSLFTALPTYGNFNWKAGVNIGNENWNSIASLNVDPGTYMVYYRLHVLNNGSTTNTTNNVYNRIFVGKTFLSNSSNSNDTPIIGTTNFTNLMGNDLEIALSFMYTNNSNKKETLYLNFQSDRNNVRRSEYAQQTSVKFKGVNLIENYFYAVKVN